MIPFFVALENGIFNSVRPAIAISLVLLIGGPVSTASIAASQPHSLPAWFLLNANPADITFSNSRGASGNPSRIIATGDFNGDGVTDFLIGDSPPTIDTPPTLARAGIIFGKKGLNTPTAIDLGTTPPDLTLTFSTGLPLGQPADIATLGDLNGDGIDDLIVTTMSSPASPSILFESITGYYAFFGSRGLGSGTLDLSTLSPDVTIVPPADALPALSGYGAIADVNGDGSPDFVFVDRSPTAPLTSHALITLGPFRTGDTVDLRSNPADASVAGAAPLRLADVNGDGISDILVRDPAQQGLNIFIGSAHLRGGVQLSSPDARVVGPSGDYLAASVATGDVNGDGVTDILLGALSTGDGQGYSQEVYVIFGSRSLSGRTIDVAQDQQDITIKGLHNNGGGGSSGLGWVTAADLNGDGLADIVVTDDYADGPQKQLAGAGAVYVVLGSSAFTHGAEVDISRFQQDVSIFGASKDEHLGYQLVGLGDFNGAGAQGFVAATADGLAYVFLGGPLRQPAIGAAGFNKRAAELLIMGTDLVGADGVEINGSIVGRPAFLPKTAELSLAGTKQGLGLQSGDNRIVVIRKGSRSNTFVLSL